jgi:hypothetical protein
MALQTAKAIATNLNHPKQSDGKYPLCNDDDDDDDSSYDDDDDNDDSNDDDDDSNDDNDDAVISIFPSI